MTSGSRALHMIASRRPCGSLFLRGVAAVLVTANPPLKGCHRTQGWGFSHFPAASLLSLSLQAMRLSAPQSQQLLMLRQAHLIKMRGIYEERQKLNLEVSLEVF